MEFENGPPFLLDRHFCVDPEDLHHHDAHENNPKSSSGMRLPGIAPSGVDGLGWARLHPLRRPLGSCEPAGAWGKQAPVPWLFLRSFSLCPFLFSGYS